MYLANTMILDCHSEGVDVVVILNHKCNRFTINLVNDLHDLICRDLYDLIVGKGIKIIIISSNFSSSVHFTKEIENIVNEINKNIIEDSNKKLNHRKDLVKVIETLEILIREEI